MELCFVVPWKLGSLFRQTDRQRQRALTCDSISHIHTFSHIKTINGMGWNGRDRHGWIHWHRSGPTEQNIANHQSTSQLSILRKLYVHIYMGKVLGYPWKLANLPECPQKCWPVKGRRTSGKAEPDIYIYII